MGDYIWIQKGSTWAMCRADPLRMGKTIVNYIRWSETGEEYVNSKGESLGLDLEVAKAICEGTLYGNPI